MQSPAVCQHLRTSVHGNGPHTMKTIVIIENEAVELKALVSLFEQWQKEINVITTVEEKAAINIMAQQHVDLVVCDLALPKHKNLEKFSLLTHTFPYIPCIALSAGDNNTADLIRRGQPTVYLNRLTQRNC